MENIFIGWSGNRSLAESVATLINNHTAKKGIVGGGSPKDMFIGAQVLSQIDRSQFAVLLVQDKENGQISHNLMFEWGYITAKLPVNNICTILINKSPRDLPSDLLGTWVFELSFDTAGGDEDALAREVLEIVERSFGEDSEKNYFNLVDRWPQIFSRLKNSGIENESDASEQILMGCLAAYYYMDNIPLRKLLDTLSGNVAINNLISFAKAYVDLFIESENMTKPLSQDAVFSLIEVFESTLSRTTKLSEEQDKLLNILCYDVYGLACSLFLKNDSLDDDTKESFAEKALFCYKTAIETIDEFSENNNCICLWQLLRSYLYNDLAHYYLRVADDMDNFKAHLAKSVEQRKMLHQTFSSLYPDNTFLITKFEQEYIIALSEQCNYMEDGFTKSMFKKNIMTRFQKWQKELIYTSSLTDRIKANIENIQ